MAGADLAGEAVALAGGGRVWPVRCRHGTPGGAGGRRRRRRSTDRRPPLSRGESGGSAVALVPGPLYIQS